MYSREKRMKAIKLYIQYNKSSARVVYELGYPSRKVLSRWYKRYQEELKTGVVWDQYTSNKRYTKEQKEVAVKHYIEHGRNASQTSKSLGYPCREILKRWCEESGMVTRKRHTNGIQYTLEQKQEMVIDLCTREGSAKEVAKANGATRRDLYSWKLKLLGKGYPKAMPKKENKLTSKAVSKDKEALLSEIEVLKNQIEKLKIEKMILDKAAEIVKKEMSIDVKTLTNKEKTMVINALKTKVSFKVLLQHTNIPRSSYFYHHKGLSIPDKYETVKIRIKDLFHENKKCYGYRRIHKSLKDEKTIISEKVVRRIMSELHLVVYGKKKIKYSSYKGDHFPSAENIIKRDFHA
ncbi:MAG: transposase, partial [Caldisericia bacterium]|nr:transposase [Caldisericia bacterium]